VSSIEESLKYAVGPSGKCTKVIASSQSVICCRGSEADTEIRTRLLHVFVYNQEVGKPSPGRPPRYLPHLEPPRFRSSVELCARKKPNEFVAKLIRRARRLGRCRDQYFWWDRRVVGGGKVGGERIRGYICCGLGSGLLLCDSGSG